MSYEKKSFKIVTTLLTKHYGTRTEKNPLITNILNEALSLAPLALVRAGSKSRSHLSRLSLMIAAFVASWKDTLESG